MQGHCYNAKQMVISLGIVVIEPYCFLDVNTTIGYEITIGRESFIGAGVLVTKNITPKSVDIVPGAQKFRLDSDSLLKLTKTN